jgi:hypothetical protein
VLRWGSVTEAEWERVGQDYGFTGLVGRVRLRYDGADFDPPTSLIAKLPMAQADVVSGYRARQERDPSLARRYYERCAREERFYREIGAAFAPCSITGHWRSQTGGRLRSRRARSAPSGAKRGVDGG